MRQVRYRNFCAADTRLKDRSLRTQNIHARTMKIQISLHLFDAWPILHILKRTVLHLGRYLEYTITIVGKGEML